MENEERSNECFKMTLNRLQNSLDDNRTDEFFGLVECEEDKILIRRNNQLNGVSIS